MLFTNRVLIRISQQLVVGFVLFSLMSACSSPTPQQPVSELEIRPPVPRDSEQLTPLAPLDAEQFTSLDPAPPPIEPVSDPQPEFDPLTPELIELLTNTARTYQNLSSYQDRFQLSVVHQVMEEQETQSQQGGLWFEKPHQFRFEIEGDDGLVVYAEPDYITTLIYAKKAYAREERFEGEHFPEGLNFGIFQFVMKVVFDLLIAEDPVPVLLDPIQAGRQVDTNDTALVGIETSIQHQEFGPVTQTLWIDPENLLITKVAMNLDHLLMRQVGRMLGISEENRDQIKMRIAGEFEDIKINEPIPTEQLTFQAPDGFERHDYLSRLLMDTQDQPDHSLLGKPAPDVKFEDLEGNEVSLSDFAGKVVMLDFWASWCAPCRYSMPVLDQVSRRFDEDEFVFLAVNTENASTAKNYLSEQSYTLEHVLIDEFGVTRAMQVQAFPQMFLVGKDGTIEKVHIGFAPFMAKELTHEIQQLIAGESLLSN